MAEATWELPAVRARGPWGLMMARLLRKRIAVGAIVVIAIIYLAGILAPWIAPYGYNDQDLSHRLLGPSLAHPFGTDWLGRDLFSRVLWSCQTTVIITVAAIIAGGLIIGLTLGLLSGYLGGWVDTLIMRLGDLFLGLPGLLILILITATVRPRVVELVREVGERLGFGGQEVIRSGVADYFLVFGALSLFAWVGTARIIRSQVLALREADFVLAARAAGASTWRILFVHIFPNIVHLIIVGITLSLGSIALSEVALSWLGIGIQPPRPSFGRLIAEASSVRILDRYPHLLLGPGLIVALLVFSFNLLGDALNDVVNPRRR